MMLYLEKIIDSEQVKVLYLCVFSVWFVPGVWARRHVVTKHLEVKIKARLRTQIQISSNIFFIIVYIKCLLRKQALIIFAVNSLAILFCQASACISIAHLSAYIHPLCIIIFMCLRFLVNKWTNKLNIYAQQNNTIIAILLKG